MKWIASHRQPPQYIWEGDEWYNETNKKIYLADIQNKCWICTDDKEEFLKYPFTKKTKIFNQCDDKAEDESHRERLNEMTLKNDAKV